jgi:hypothetical protein
MLGICLKIGGSCVGSWHSYQPDQFTGKAVPMLLVALMVAR